MVSPWCTKPRNIINNSYCVAAPAGGSARKISLATVAFYRLVPPNAAIIIEMRSEYAIPIRHVSTGVSLKRLPLAERARSMLEAQG